METKKRLTVLEKKKGNKDDYISHREGKDAHKKYELKL